MHSWWHLLLTVKTVLRPGQGERSCGPAKGAGREAKEAGEIPLQGRVPASNLGVCPNAKRHMPVAFSHV